MNTEETVVESQPTPAPIHDDGPPLPESFPATCDDFLRLVVAVAGLYRHDQLMRLRSHVAAVLKRTHPGANDSDTKAVFIARQKRTFNDAAEWSAAAQAYREWWSHEREAIAARTQKNLQKPIDQVAERQC
jgi:hypothetical protein